jgi:cell shape-determining protein MreC
MRRFAYYSANNSMKRYTQRLLRAVLLMLCSAILLQTSVAPAVMAQAPASQHGQGLGSSEPLDPAVARLEKEAQKRRNLQREQEIRQDSEKLLELATELKQYVDKTNEHVISLDVIRKAEQIEKLAKVVREKMKAE